jgi:dUTP pyrophosphatase
MPAKDIDGTARIGIKYLEHHEGLPGIGRGTPGASGLDLHAACTDDIVIAPGKVALVPSGIALSIPEGYEGQVRPRSGLALNSGIGLLNSPGTIDSDYRGEIGIIMFNFGGEDFIVKRGDRVAQIVFCRIPRIELQERPHLDATDRGCGGFGHTGKER